jgi:iron complex outermembrane recepter protein
MQLHVRVLLGYLLLVLITTMDVTPVYAASVIEEIIVTARKREESLQDVPIAIQAIMTEKIERYDADNLSEIADMANNVQISGGTNGAGGSFVIRGLGSNAGDSGIDSSVATNIDGVQIARGFIARTAFFDVESVQFLKGPQALFFGKNSPAGVVGVVTANPTDEFHAKASLGYEPEAEEQIFEGMVSGPLTDTVRARLAFRYTDIGGWIDNNAQFQENSNGEVIPPALAFGFWPSDETYYDLPGALNDIGAIETYTGRLTVDWTPTDNFRARFKATLMQEKSDGLVAGEFANCTDPTNPSVLPIGFPAKSDPFHDCRLNNETSQGNVPPEVAARWNIPVKNLYSEYDAQLYSLDMEYETSWGSISSITGWIAYDFEGLDNFGGLQYPFFIGYNPDEHEQISQELRLATNLDTPFNYMLGLHYDSFERTHANSSKLGLFGLDPVTGFSNDQHVVQYTEGDSWSVFGSVIWDINDQWELAAGGRYVKDTKDGTQRHVYVHSVLQLIGWFPPGVDLVAGTDDTDFSPEVTLTWRPTTDLTLWAAWKNGYKAGGYSAPTVLTNTFGPDNITFGEEDAGGYEIGVKTTLLDGQMTLNVTLYDYTFDDLQVSQFRPETTTYVIGNAAKATTQGIEFDLTYQVNEQLVIYAEGGYNNAEYDDYPQVACYAFQPRAPGQCETFAGGLEFQDLSGETLAAAPDFAGSVGFEFTQPLSNNWNFVLASEAIYTDDYRTASNGEPLAVQPSFTRIRARLGLMSADGQWEFALIGRNLTDKIWAIGGARPGAITPADQGGGGSRPRSLLFQATYRI